MKKYILKHQKKLFNMIRIGEDSADIHYKSLLLTRKYFGKGKNKRSLYTFNALKLIQTTHGATSKAVSKLRHVPPPAEQEQKGQILLPL